MPDRTKPSGAKDDKKKHTMKTCNSIIFTTAVIAAVGGTASAAVTTYSNIGGWTNAAGAVITSQVNGYLAGNGIAGDPTPIPFSTSGSGASASISDGGFYYAGASLSAGGTGSIVTTGTTLTFSAGANTSTLTFVLNTNVWGFAMQYTTSAGIGELFLQGNAAPPLGQSEVTVGPWMGVVNTAGTVNQVVMTLQGGDTVTITGVQYLMIPGPGAAALTSVACLVGVSRRRRS